MSRQLLVLGFLFPAFVFAQAELVLKSDNLKFPASRVQCEIKGADLFVVVGDIETKSGAVFSALLRNYGTVVTNATDPTVSFQINDPTVGAVSLLDHGNHWRVHNAKGLTTESNCAVSATAEAAGELAISISCTKLSLLDEKLTLAEKQKRMIESVALSEPVRCVPRKRN